MCCLAADRAALEEVPQLPAPAVERLFSAAESDPIIGACAFGDALSGIALALLTADGRHHCLRPSSSLITDQVCIHRYTRFHRLMSLLSEQGLISHCSCQSQFTLLGYSATALIEACLELVLYLTKRPSDKPKFCQR